MEKEIHVVIADFDQHTIGDEVQYKFLSMTNDSTCTCITDKQHFYLHKTS